MVNAMKYGKGLSNSRFDIVQFDRLYLDKLYDESGDYYVQLSQRLKNVFPQYIEEIRNTYENNNPIYISSAHDKPYDFKDGKVKELTSR